MAIRVDIDRARANRVAATYSSTWVRGLTWDIERHARKMVRVRSGRTRSKIYTVPPRITARFVRGTVRCDSKIAVIEDRGSPPHIIRQRPNGPLLRFFWEREGRWVRTAKVRHPGTGGSRFLTGALVLVAEDNGMRVRVNFTG